MVPRRTKHKQVSANCVYTHNQSASVKLHKLYNQEMTGSLVLWPTTSVGWNQAHTRWQKTHANLLLQSKGIIFWKNLISVADSTDSSMQKQIFARGENQSRRPTTSAQFVYQTPQNHNSHITKLCELRNFAHGTIIMQHSHDIQTLTQIQAFAQWTT